MPGGGGGTKRIGVARVILSVRIIYGQIYANDTFFPIQTLNAYAKRFQELKADLAQIEYFSKGTLLARMVRCGKPQCACGKDPSKRHGHYYEWTYKARGKTVTVRLAPEAAPFFRAAAKQYHKLKTILNRMETLSRQALGKLAKDPSSRSSI